MLHSGFKRTNNTISRQAQTNVRLVYQRLRQLPYFHLPAVALMDVAHDFHRHGSPDENKLAECIVSGVAKGLGVDLPMDPNLPLCPHCGQRHAPSKAMEAFMKTLLKSFAGR